MKKILLATTLLAASAGFAAAEVTLSGDGRMGVVYNGEDLNFTSRIRVKFTASGETDGGLAFGGSFRVDHEDEDGSSASRGGAGSVYISGGFGKLEMGDVVGAAEAAVGDMPEVGLTDLGANDNVYITGDGAEVGNDNPVALYSYSMNNFTIYASLNDGKVGNTSIDDVQAMSLGVKYATDVFSVGLGYETADPAGAGDSIDHVILGGSYTFNTTTVSAVYGEASDIDFTQMGLGLESTFGATTITAFIRNEELGAADVTFYGLGAAYDLGGGATLKAGIADNDAAGSDAVADFGIAMSF